MSKIKTDATKLVNKHQNLSHSVDKKVTSHVQREEGEWLVNTVMIEGCESPFQFKRKQAYQNLTGARVNLTYYPDTKEVAGIHFEVMKVVRIRIS